MLRASVTAGIVAALCSPALADWQYTKWGMTPAQIVAASKGEAKPYGPGRNYGCVFTGQTPIAVAPNKQIGSARYDVTFCSLGNGRLGAVALRPIGDPILAALKRELLSTYGEPISDRRGQTIWNDKRTRNTITLSDVGGIAIAIEYKAMGGGGGL